MTGGAHLLRILHLASPALPIGAFHFSQGLEYAVEAGWIRDERSSLEWIAGLADNAIGTLDLPVLLRLHRASVAGDCMTVQRWSRFLIAARETEELRAEDRHLGAALLRVLQALDVPMPAAVRPDALSYAAVFAQVCAHWSITEMEALQAYAWTWAENQMLAAVKLVPLGQSAGQRIVHALVPRLAEIVASASCIEDQDIGAIAVMQGIASARHESQYTRLFRS